MFREILTVSRCQSVFKISLLQTPAEAVGGGGRGAGGLQPSTFFITNNFLSFYHGQFIRT